MIGVTKLRCGGHLKYWNSVLTVNAFKPSSVGLATQNRSFSKKSDTKESECCKDLAQTEGRKVEPWPRDDPPRQGAWPKFDHKAAAWRCECPRDPPPPNNDPYRIKLPETVVPPIPPPDVKPMMSCARTRGPCSGTQIPDLPPDPPPPRKPFPWIYVWAIWAVMGFFGMLYKYYLYRETFASKSSNSQWQPRRVVKRPRHEEDLPPCVQYLIIGTGAAGWAAYQAIKETDKTAKVLFVTKEDMVPYSRPPMSKHMWWNAQPPDVMTLNYVEDLKRKSMLYAQCKDFMDPLKFYRKKKGPAVALASGWCVLRVDADEHIAWIKTFCGERPIYYERCLIAPGSKPKNMTIFKTAPKSVRKKVCRLRTIRDLEIAYRKVRDAKHITIIGGGMLGTELAWYISKMHKEWIPPPPEHEPVQVTHVVKTPGILGHILPDYLGVWATEKLKCESVQIIPKTCVYDAYENNEGRLTLTLSNGDTLETDYVFVCVGAVPREELAQDSYLELDPVNGGFMVNAELQIRKHLWVAGDAASVFCPWKDTRIRMDHYLNAEEQGAIAGGNMAGLWTPCQIEPHYWLRLGETLQMEVIGEVGACMPTIGVFLPCQEDEETIKYDMAIGEFGKPCYKQSGEYKQRFRRGIVYYLRDETVVGIAFWNVPPIEDRLEVTTEILRARPSFEDISILTELLGMADIECGIYISPDDKKRQVQLASSSCIKSQKH